MDRLIFKFFIGTLVMCSTIIACTKTKLKFLQLDEILNCHNDSCKYEPFYDNFLYLGSSAIESVNKKFPEVLSVRHKNLEDFIIKRRDKTSISLKEDYHKVEDVIRNMESEVIYLLKSKFGINNPINCLSDTILVHKNFAFLEFIGDGIIHGITFELTETNQLFIGIAFIIIE
ncbi:MAG: hypothetical protein ACK5OS_00965 [Chryseotalea sp.]